MSEIARYLQPNTAPLTMPCYGVDGARILVVDDSTDNLQIAGSVFLKQGCEVYVADSGSRALEMAVAVKPDLILLDLMMPEMNGIETCERLKLLDDVREVPVIILTAAGDEHFAVDSFAVGAADYVQKPFSPAVLLARAATHVKLYRRTRELENLAHIDSLTGLPNRRAFEQRLMEDWKRGGRNGATLGVLMVDVDYFKQYNDHYGHPQGDQALRTVAAALQTAARRVNDFCGRYGGEEFVVLSLADDNADIEALVARIGVAVRGLAIPHEGLSIEARLTASVGYACVSPRDALDPQALIEAADQALYRAKSNGRDRAERALLNIGQE